MSDRVRISELAAEVEAEAPLPLGAIRLSTVEMEQVEWVEKPHLLNSALILLCGRPDAGKGTICANWAARCTNGDLYGRPRNVLILASEDSDSIDLKPRIVVAGGDPYRVVTLPSAVCFPRDIDGLRELARVVGDVGLVIIDPVGNHTGDANTDRDSDIRAALMPLNDLAGELRCPVIGIRHLTTKEAKGGSLRAILGGTGWVAVPRLVLIAVSHEGVTYVQAKKGNRVPRGDSARAYRIEGRYPEGFTESVSYAAPLGASDVDVDELLEGGGGNQGDQSRSEAARELILTTLRERGRVESDELDAHVAEQAGIAARTAKNLRKGLTSKGWVKSAAGRLEHGEVGRWYVELTNAAPPAAYDEGHRARGGKEPRAPSRNHAESDETRASGLGALGALEARPHARRASSNGSIERAVLAAVPSLPADAPEWERAYWERRRRSEPQPEGGTR